MRVLQTMMAFGGNAQPQLAVTRRLVERGHEVRVLAHRAARQRIEATGAEFVEFRQSVPGNAGTDRRAWRPHPRPILELIDPSHVWHGPTILDFEFAGSRSRAAQIKAEWGAEGSSAAHLSLVLDYGYMLSYGLFFAFAGSAVRDTARARGWRRLAALWESIRQYPLFRIPADTSR